MRWWPPWRSPERSTSWQCPTWWRDRSPAPTTASPARPPTRISWRHWLSSTPCLVSRLTPAFYVDLDRVRDAIQRRSSFNAIHLATMVKVDVFILKDTPLGRQEMERRQPMRLPDLPEIVLHVASAEDTVVQKLAWYRLDREVPNTNGRMSSGSSR